MSGEAAADWAVRLKNMPFEELAAKYAPLIAKYARWRIPGLDQDDIAQEVRTVLWKCQQQYDPGSKPGHDGRPSSFTNYLIRSIENWLGKQPRRFSQSYYAPVTALECQGCGAQASVGTRSCACGGKRWKAVHGGALVSYDAPDPSQRFIEPEDGDFEDDVVSGVTLKSVIGAFPPDVRADIETFLSGAPIMEQRRRRIRRKGEPAGFETVAVDVTKQRMARIRSL